MATRDWYVGSVLSVHEWLDDGRFCVCGDLRGRVVPRSMDNYDAEAKIKSVLAEVPEVLALIDFDPEMCEFFAYTKNFVVAQILTGVILGLCEKMEGSLLQSHN